MTQYRFVFGSLRSEKVIAELALHGTYLDNELNVGGRFDGSFSLDQRGRRNQVMLDATEPGRTFVVVERDDKPIWGGFVWSRVFQSQSKNVQLFAQSFDKLPDYQLVASDFSAVGEQLDIFHALWAHMQVPEGRDFNILTETDPHPVVVQKVLDVRQTDFKYYGEAMSSLSDSSDGFDWTIDIQKDGALYRKVLRTGYPVLGQPNPNNLTFEYPGAILNYYAIESMTSAGTNVFTLGSGEGSTMVYRESVQTAMIAHGFPRWDRVISRKDVEQQALIDTMAAQEGASRKPPMLLLKPTLKAGRPNIIVPDFGSFGLGDACRVVIKDSRFPQGLQFNTRVVKWTLHPQAADNTDEYSVTFENDDEEL